MVKLRNAHYCNTKLFLIFLVIYGHLIESWIDKSNVLLQQYRWIYFFHMPLYLDEVCSEESRQLVEEHLADCEACRKLVEATTKVECKKTEEETVEKGVVKRSFNINQQEFSHPL